MPRNLVGELRVRADNRVPVAPGVRFLKGFWARRLPTDLQFPWNRANGLVRVTEMDEQISRDCM